MTGTDVTNIDLKAAATAQTISKLGQPKVLENLVTKTLGVLQENGVYACLLFLYARSIDRDVARAIAPQLLGLTKVLGKTPPAVSAAETDLEFLLKHICADLDTLLLVKQLWEQTLIYARYGAKARSGT